MTRLRGTPPGVVGACSGPSGVPPVAPVAPWLSSCGASQYRTRGLIPGREGPTARFRHDGGTYWK